MKEWIEKNKGTVFRFCQYRLPGAYTPYEQQQCFSDESLLESSFYSFCRFTNAIDLGSGDWLLECEMLDSDIGEIWETDVPRYEYHRLSRLKITKYPSDMETLEKCMEDEMEDS